MRKEIRIGKVRGEGTGTLECTSRRWYLKRDYRAGYRNMSDNLDAAMPLRAGMDDIKRMIPHRHPFLMIDSVENIVPGESAVGIKSVTGDEPFFEGHFPGNPIMPGVLIVEAIAQTAAVLVVKTLDMQDKNILVYLLTADKCKFRNLVKPSTRLELHVKVIRGRGRVWRVGGVCKVDGKAVAEAEVNAMMVVPEDRN